MPARAHACMWMVMELIMMVMLSGGTTHTCVLISNKNVSNAVPAWTRAAPKRAMPPCLTNVSTANGSIYPTSAALRVILHPPWQGSSGRA
eukprot:9484917-Pyramimonas_sp.AAC.1